ncbi:MAG: FAD-dependent oxidoreductase [bacterium]|nr:MAG: FAD-dependent oxidoreductase [bacterium]
MKDYDVTTLEIIERTPTCLSVRTGKPEGFTFMAGQWGLFTPVASGITEGKPLSFSSSPTEPFLEFTKRISGSAFSGGIRSLRPGDPVHFRGPAGNLVLEGGEGKILFVVGGIGITPIRSILRYMADSGHESDGTLLFANRSLDEIPFREELESMASGGSWLRVIHVLEDPPTGWKGPTGFVTLDTLREQVSDLKERAIFLCGPPPMVSCLEGMLSELGVPENRVRKEQLEGYEGLT